MSEKILIVDDEPSNRNILRQELAHRGYTVETANDGAEALKKVESDRKSTRLNSSHIQKSRMPSSA